MKGNSGKLFIKAISFKIISKESSIGNQKIIYLTNVTIPSRLANEDNFRRSRENLIYQYSVTRFEGFGLQRRVFSIIGAPFTLICLYIEPGVANWYIIMFK